MPAKDEPRIPTNPVETVGDSTGPSRSDYPTLHQLYTVVPKLIDQIPQSEYGVVEKRMGDILTQVSAKLKASRGSGAADLILQRANSNSADSIAKKLTEILKNYEPMISAMPEWWNKIKLNPIVTNFLINQF